MIKTVLITGANAGLGKETARQLAQQPGIERIYLGCRNLEKAKLAQSGLEQLTGKHLFEILPIDVGDLNSVRNAVGHLPGSIDALVMNAGGAVGKVFNQKTLDGVTQIFAVNLLGHAVLTEELLKAGKLTQVALYAGSEAARGVTEMGMKRPDLKTSSIDEFASVGDGSFYATTNDATISYGAVKYMAALWMASMARRHPQVRFITPGFIMGMLPGSSTSLMAFIAL